MDYGLLKSQKRLRLCSHLASFMKLPASVLHWSKMRFLKIYFSAA